MIDVPINHNQDIKLIYYLLLKKQYKRIKNKLEIEYIN